MNIILIMWLFPWMASQRDGFPSQCQQENWQILGLRRCAWSSFLLTCVNCSKVMWRNPPGRGSRKKTQPWSSDVRQRSLEKRWLKRRNLWWMTRSWHSSVPRMFFIFSKGESDRKGWMPLGGHLDESWIDIVGNRIVNSYLFLFFSPCGNQKVFAHTPVSWNFKTSRQEIRAASEATIKAWQVVKLRFELMMFQSTKVFHFKPHRSQGCWSVVLIVKLLRIW